MFGVLTSFSGLTLVSWFDSIRFVVWFGNAPGHDPSGGVTEAITIAALNAEGIVVGAIDVGNLDITGQATRITDATGGLVSSDSGDISDLIAGSIPFIEAFYSVVSLTPMGNLPGVGVDTCDRTFHLFTGAGRYHHTEAGDRQHQGPSTDHQQDWSARPLH